MPDAVIVIESPNKVKKVKKYSGYDVVATVGHFKDLPSSSMGVNLETYEPVFEVQPKKEGVVKDLKSKCEGKVVYIATDPDREGYAIGMDVYNLVKNISKKCLRTEMNEITKAGVQQALNNSTPFEQSNFKFYDAFVARRVIDRITGYCLSPEASRDIGEKGYSVGRVQSPAVRIIVEREREIDNFTPEPFYNVIANLEFNGEEFDASSIYRRMKNQEDAQSILDAISGASHAEVVEVEKKKATSKPPAPFTTSTMQIAMSKILNLNPDQAMTVCQKLFEAGLITYHRTDSTRLSDEFITHLRDYIGSHYPDALPGKPIVHKSKNSQAEAHEAIRPTEVYDKSSISEKIAEEGLTELHEKVLTIIWEQTVASQMAPAVYNQTKITFDIAGEEFKANGKVLVDPGYLVIGRNKLSKDVELPAMNEGDTPIKVGQEIKKGMTKPPNRYSMASLVEKLEALGIGRPSTYASITKTIQNRGYVQIQKKNLVPTKKGYTIIDHLKEKRDWIIDYEMTRQMEAALDEVENGGVAWASVVYGYHNIMGKIDPSQFSMLSDGEVVDKCPRKGCGGEISDKGKFFGCSNWREKNCKIFFPKTIAGVDVTPEMVKTLLEHGSIDEEMTFISKKGTNFRGFLELEKNKINIRYSND